MTLSSSEKENNDFVVNDEDEDHNNNNTNMKTSSSTVSFTFDDDTDDDEGDGPSSSSSSQRHATTGCGRTESSPPHQPYNAMLQMTLELVQDIVTARVGDTVMTAFGTGTVLSRGGPSMEIQLPFGRLYVRTKDMIHKILPEDEFDAALDQLEQARKYQILQKLQEYNLPMQMDTSQACVACLFRTNTYNVTPATSIEEEEEDDDDDNEQATSRSTTPPRPFRAHSPPRDNNNTSTDTQNNSHTSKRRWWKRPNLSSFSLSSSNTSSTSPKNHQKQQQSPPRKTKTSRTTKNFCQVCGNPVCTLHSKKSSATVGNRGGRMLFCMCLDCSLDLHALEHQLNPHHPQLLQVLQRLVYYYTRMLLQLSVCMPRLQQLACHLTQSEQRHSQISLGTSGLGFVGAALGVAGTAAMLTPAGPAIILAAIATSATSGTLQMTHAGYKSLWSNQTTAHQLADKVIAWHGLCLGILQALEQLRMDLLTEKQSVSLAQSRRVLRKLTGGDQTYNSVWNTLAVGGFTTSRHAMTGVSVTSAMGASYSQAINTSLQGIPVVGAAFSVGCMAMDAHNIQSSLRQLQQPSFKANALRQVQDSFLVHVPNTIVQEVLVLGEAIEDLRARILQQTLERDLEDERRLAEEQEELLERELRELE